MTRVYLYHLRRSWFSENFGFLIQPFNKPLTMYLATLQALEIQHKDTCPHGFTLWPGGRVCREMVKDNRE